MRIYNPQKIDYKQISNKQSQTGYNIDNRINQSLNDLTFSNCFNSIYFYIHLNFSVTQ